MAVGLDVKLYFTAPSGMHLEDREVAFGVSNVGMHEDKGGYQQWRVSDAAAPWQPSLWLAVGRRLHEVRLRCQARVTPFAAVRRPRRVPPSHFGPLCATR